MPGKFDEPQQHSLDSLQNTKGFNAKMYDEDSRYNRVSALDNHNGDSDGAESRRDYDEFRFGNSGAHTRTSSSDSTEWSSSRKSSTEFIPTRPSLQLGTAVPTTDPLQFIKSNQINPLAQQAKETVEVMADQKKHRPTVHEEEDNWQSWNENLSSWKQKMRRKSHGTYRGKQIEEEEEDPNSRKKSKTFKEMMEERERRKSGGYNIYPFGAEDSSNQSSVRQSQEEVSENISESTQLQSRQKRRNYGFYQDIDDDDSVFSKKSSGQTSQNSTGQVSTGWKTVEEPSVEERKVVTEEVQKEAKKDKIASWAQPENRDNKKEETSPTFSSRDSEENKRSKTPERSKPWERSYPNRTRENKSVTPERDTRQPEQESRENAKKFGSVHHNFEKTESVEEEKGIGRTVGKLAPSSWFQQNSEEEPKSQSWKTELDGEFDGVKSIRNRWKRSEDDDKLLSRPSNDQVNSSEEFRNVQNIRNQWKHSEEAHKTSQPSNQESTRWRQQGGEGHGQEEFQDVSSVRQRWRQNEKQTQSLLEENNNSQWKSQHKPQRETWESQRINSNTRPPQRDIFTNKVQEERIQPDSEVLARTAPPTTDESAEKKYMEKVIKINQKANHPKGFGFSIQGGKEHKKPIVVEKVTLGSAADVCELLSGDELVSINGAEVGGHYKESVMHVIDKAVSSGQLELRVRRYLSKDEDEDEDMKDEDFEMEMRSWSKGHESPVESINSEDERLEQQIMDKLEEEAKREEADEREKQKHLAEAEKLSQLHLEDDIPKPTEEAADEDEPPPLPNAPPPPPNWSTFPSAPANNENSFLDSSDLLPDQPQQVTQQNGEAHQIRPDSGEDKSRPEFARMDSVTRLRTDILRRKSEFLGLNVEETEEYKKLQSEKEKEAKKKEENVWQKIENKEFIASTSSFTIDPKLAPPDRREPDVIKVTRSYDEAVHSKSPARYNDISQTAEINSKSGALNDLWQHVETTTKGHRPEFDLEKQEQEIIENLEREEAARQKSIASTTSKWTPSVSSSKQEPLRAWKSMEALRPSGLSLPKEDSGNSLQQSRDMESAPIPLPRTTKFGGFNLEDEKRRMEQWNKDQEKMRQLPPDGDTYKVETTINLQEKFQNDQGRMQQIYNEDLKKSQELEAQRKEREHLMLQKDLERQREAELHWKEFEEKERRRKAEEERKMKEEEEQRMKWEQEKRYLEEMKIKTTDLTPAPYPYSNSSTIDANRLHREDAWKQQEARLKQEETERLKREEEEARQLREKESQLLAMEERIKREAEQLRQERERLQREKEIAPQSPTTPTFHFTPTGAALYRPNQASAPSSTKAEVEKTPQFKVEIQTDPSKRVIMDRKPLMSYDLKSPGYNFDINVTQTVTPPGVKPGTFPPAGRDYTPSPPVHQTTPPPGREEITVQHSVLSRKPQQVQQATSGSQVRRYSYAAAEGGSPLLSREEIVRLNRLPGAKKQESFDDSDIDERYRAPTTYPDNPLARPYDDSPVTSSDAHGMYHPQDPSAPHPLGRHGLHDLSAAPRKHLHNEWVKPNEVKPNTDHWLVDEAERRRQADQPGVGHHGYYPTPQTSQHSNLPGSTHSHDDGGYRGKYHTPTHIMEHTEVPHGHNTRPARPIPEAIKQTLIQRVTSPRTQSQGPTSPTGYSSHSSTGYPHQGSGYPHFTHSSQSSTASSHSDRSPPQYQHYGGHPGQLGSNHSHYGGSQGYLGPYSSGGHHPAGDQNHPGNQYGNQGQGYQGGNPAGQTHAGHTPYYTATSASGSGVHGRSVTVPPAKPPRTLQFGYPGNQGDTEPVVAVSGRKKCAHCEDELGHGDAMVIESLGLSYHIGCFRCCVCRAPLGTGQKGADVRVRFGKLHCHNCYSNDEAWFS